MARPVAIPPSIRHQFPVSYRVLVTDEIDADGVALLVAEPDLRIDEVPTLPKEDLLARIGEYDAIIGRSATRISPELLRAARRLRVVGRAGVGVDNIALDVATELGIAVVNAPAGNSVAVAELVFGALLNVLRGLSHATVSMREGRWDRADLMGTELNRKTLAIVGLGRIGGEVAVRAAAFGMKVVAYDPYVADARFQSLRVDRLATLDAALEIADVLTIHTPLTAETRGMIGRREIARLGAGAIVVNMARGGIVDEQALADALREGRLRAAALDAFDKEPLPPDSPLRGVPHLHLTPHIGASTMEAQRNVSVDACSAVRDALLRGELSRSINIAEIGATRWHELQPTLDLTLKLGAVSRALLASQGARAVGAIDVRTGAALADARAALVASAAVGVLQGVMEDERLNIINARAIAQARGIELAFTESTQAEGRHAVEVRVRGGMQEIGVAGVALPGASPRLTRIGAFRVDVQPRDTLLILTNRDVPGVIGRVGTLLGHAGVNIAEYHQARLAQGGEALAAVSVDGPIDENVRGSLLELPDVNSATVLTFRDT
jgi:D-3-phosphoglycerate dehydrogenase